MNNLLEIREILQNERFQQIQDALATSIGLAIITVDYKGIPITQHSSRTEFCSIMRKSAHFSKLCERCDSRGGLEAATTHSPYIYLCHAGLIDLAIPIVIDNNYLGAVMAGQVLLSKNADTLKLEQICHSFESNISFEDVNTLHAYRALPTMPLNEIQTIADMLYSICTIIIDETRLRFYFRELKKNKNHIHVDEEFVDTYTHMMANQYFDFSEVNLNTNVLKPAFDYICENLDGDLSIKKVASICNISPSYFSKLFFKENLGYYSDFINKMKLEHAKTLLSSTNMSINEISLKLNYCDCGYFIKVFKKLEKMTPATYRKSKAKITTPS